MLNEAQMRVAMRLYRYFGDVCQRAQSATVLPARAVTFEDGTAPQRCKCHDNVARWLAENPADSAVRGWLVTGDPLTACIFELHSVVRAESGDVIDITPMDYTLRFVPHLGTEEEFQDIYRRNLHQVTWPQPSPEEQQRSQT